jgi:acyl-coenzyme A thioesterase PaaI-like protein
VFLIQGARSRVPWINAWEGTSVTGAERGLAYHGIGGDLAEDPVLDDRRRAIAELGDALRDLVQLAVATEAPAEELRRAAALVREATAPLAQPVRRRTEMPGADDLLHGIRMYNPVTGTGSPISPPLRIEIVDGVVVGTCELGLAFEGPPMFTHGGVSAMLLDQMLGYAAGVAGRPGLTVSLETRYRRPVPLQTPLRLTAVTTEFTERGVVAQGAIATADDPDTALVEATATFRSLRPEQAVKLFGAALHPDATDPSTAHD